MSGSGKLQNDSKQLKTQMHEFQKTHTVYDGSSRPIYYYEAGSAVVDGGACMVTLMGYVGAETVVSTTKEQKATWDAAWEAELPPWPPV